VIRKTGINRSATLINQGTQILGYADLDIAGCSVKVVKETFEEIEREARRVGLIVNEEKTKFLIVSRNQAAQKRIRPILEISGYKFETVNQ